MQYNLYLLNVNLSSTCLFLLVNVELYNKCDGPSCLFICGISELHPLVLSLDSELSSIPFAIPLLVDEANEFKSDL